jgi:hypothetical protein
MVIQHVTSALNHINDLLAFLWHKLKTLLHNFGEEYVFYFYVRVFLMIRDKGRDLLCARETDSNSGPEVTIPSPRCALEIGPFSGGRLTRGGRSPESPAMECTKGLWIPLSERHNAMISMEVVR